MTARALERLIALKLGMTATWLFPFEMTVLAANLLIAVVSFFRWLRWLPAIPLAAGVLSVLNLVPLRFLTLAYPVVVIFFAIGWSRAAGEVAQGGQTPGATGAGNSARVSSTRRRRTPLPPSAKTDQNAS